VNPYSAVSGATPVRKETEHYFFKLSECADFLRDWTRSGTLQAEAANKMSEWVGETGENKLSDWDISRDAPYFGFEIPDAPGKYFYVWLDAPIGYMASFKNLCSRAGLDFDEYWKKTQKLSCTILSARIFYISTLYSGPPRWSTLDIAHQLRCSRMVS